LLDVHIGLSSRSIEYLSMQDGNLTGNQYGKGQRNAANSKETFRHLTISCPAATGGKWQRLFNHSVG